MGSIIEHVDVDVDVSTAYNQWTQFEDFPQFMEGVEKVVQLDDTRVGWQVDIAGSEREFVTEITEQTPDHRIAWKSTSGLEQAGVVTFHALNDDQTRVTVQLEFHPEGIVERVGDTLGVAARRTKGDLKRFKAFLEERGSESGAWRGTVRRDTEAPM